MEVRAGTLIIGIIIISMEMKKDKIEVHVQQREVAKKRLKVNCIYDWTLSKNKSRARYRH